MSRHVLITRPEQEAGALAADVRALGWKAVFAPMLFIVPVNATLPDLTQFSALVFTSANGVRAFAALSPARGHRVYCVGDACAAVALDCGWQDVHSAKGDAADVMALLAAEISPGARLLHPAGDAVAREIAVDGAEIERLTVYRAEAAAELGAEVLSMMEEGRLDAALFFSARTAGVFAGLLAGAGRTEAVRSTKALCLADSVVSSLRHLNWQDVQVSARPDREAMLALLKSLP